MKRLSLLLLSSALLACTAPQKPYRFSLQADKGEAMGTIRGALAEQGQETEYIDEQAGIIRTRWVDTGFLMGEVQDQSATVVRRYTVIVSGQPTGPLDLTVRADTKRCAQDGFEISGEMITGACEVMNELAPAHQKELDALGTELQNRLSQRT